jgi:preprotein translocase subunit SecY
MLLKRNFLGFRIAVVGFLGVVAAASEKSGVNPIAITTGCAVLICVGVTARFFLRIRHERRRDPQIIPAAKSRSTAAGL